MRRPVTAEPGTPPADKAGVSGAVIRDAAGERMERCRGEAAYTTFAGGFPFL